MTVNARIGSIMLPDKESQCLNIAAAVGLEDAIVKTASVRMGEGISGKVVQTGKVLFKKNYYDGEAFRSVKSVKSGSIVTLANDFVRAEESM